MFTYEYQIQQGSELLSLYPDISKLFYAKTNTTGNIFFVVVEIMLKTDSLFWRCLTSK